VLRVNIARSAFVPVLKIETRECVVRGAGGEEEEEKKRKRKVRLIYEKICSVVSSFSTTEKVRIGARPQCVCAMRA